MINLSRQCGKKTLNSYLYGTKDPCRILKWMRGFTCLQCVHLQKNLHKFKYWPNDWLVKIYYNWWKGEIDFHVKLCELYLCRFFVLNEREIGVKGKGIKRVQLPDRVIIL